MKRKLGVFFMCMGVVLLLGALTLFGYNQWESQQAEEMAEDLLSEMKLMIDADTETPAPTGKAQPSVAVEEATPEPIPTIDPTMTEKKVNGYWCIGYVTIPTLDLELPVLNSWSSTNAKAGPCWYYGSTKTADMVICAHSYRKYFGRIDQLRPGDEVLFTDMDGVLWQYEVVETEILQPTDIEKMTEGQYALTLFSCTLQTPKNRITVRCRAKS